VEETIIAFKGQDKLSSGPISSVAKNLKSLVDQGDAPNYLIFKRSSGQQIDLDLTGSVTDVEQRYSASVPGRPADSAAEAPPKTRGRPKLGVVGREVTLLPRHWEWLDRQRGGSSAALRRLIDAERKNNVDEDKLRRAQDSTNRFIYAMAGNLAGFEEAVRALYAGDKAGFTLQIRSWPADIKQCTMEFARDAFAAV